MVLEFRKSRGRQKEQAAAWTAGEAWHRFGLTDLSDCIAFAWRGFGSGGRGEAGVARGVAYVRSC